MTKIADAAKNPGIVIFVLLLGALSFATALAWNDFIQSAVQKYVDVDESNGKVKAQAYYAGIITVILVISVYALVKFKPQTFNYM